MESNFILPSIDSGKSYNSSNTIIPSPQVNRAASMASNGVSNTGGNKESPINSALPQVIELNVGGNYYTTALSTLMYESGSLLANMFTGSIRVPKDSRGRYFIDRDGTLFRYVLDYLRNSSLSLPSNFEESERLLAEAEYFRLRGLCKLLRKPQPNERYGGKPAKQQNSGFVSLCVRGTYAFGRDGIADIKFRKLQRILVCGNVGLTREVFQDTLNETRDPDRETSGYSSRFYLKHPHLELAFDRLHYSNFKMVTSAAGGAGYDPESEETKWNHFTNYVFFREPALK